ncbi:glycine-N-acyltransferase-like protein 3 [Babylonia areolata]|uniref:glycine-N-acyltransferase-like protein 3 n=1 Tax=Babylonia areolata TaxID=304850 RepID=UPI003FD4761E
MAEFVELSGEQLPKLMEKLKQFLPDALSIFYTADNTVRGRLTLEDVHFYVNVWPNPTCVVLLSPAQSGQLHNYRTTVDVWSENCEEVISFFRHSSILDWSEPVFFRVQHVSDPDLKAVLASMEEKKGRYNCVERHVYVHDSSPLERTSLPEGYALLDRLSADHAKTVGHQYTAWGVEPSQAVRYFQQCSAHLPSSGVCAQNGQLVSYAALHHTSALGSVVTDPQHQRKGLGTVVVTDVCRKIRADGQTPYVYVNPDNVGSAGLYKKCGFEYKIKAFRVRYVPEK